MFENLSFELTWADLEGPTVTESALLCGSYQIVGIDASKNVVEEESPFYLNGDVLLHDLSRKLHDKDDQLTIKSVSVHIFAVARNFAEKEKTADNIISPEAYIKSTSFYELYPIKMVENIDIPSVCLHDIQLIESCIATRLSSFEN